MGSIIDDKYKGNYRKPQDWVAQLLADNCTEYTETTRTVKDEDGNETTETIRKASGVSISALFKLGRDNNLNLAKFEGVDPDSPGFVGRFRMSLGNMLRAAAAKRHGLYVNGEWVPAPAEWLRARNAPVEPTHDREGNKIPAPKAKDEVAEAA